MNYLISFFSMLSAFFYPYKTVDEPEEISIVEMYELSQKITPEIHKVLPKTIIGTGYSNLIGAEHLRVFLHCPSTEFSQMKEFATLAHAAGSQGLNHCKNLYNHTNHGPTSPNLISIELMTDEGFVRAGFQDGKFCPPGDYRDFKEKNYKVSPFLKITIESLNSQSYQVDHASFYETQIEKDKQALGLDIWFNQEKVGLIEECLDQYKLIYSQLKNSIQEQYPDHFLMLYLTFKEPSRYGIAIYNVRNHIHFYEDIPTGNGQEMRCKRYYRPYFLNDLVRLPLQRPYY
jgi:hypothetical protein